MHERKTNTNLFWQVKFICFHLISATSIDKTTQLLMDNRQDLHFDNEYKIFAIKRFQLKLVKSFPIPLCVSTTDTLCHSYNNCNPGGPVGLPQGCKPIHWNPNTFLEKKVCWQIAQKLQKTSMANFTYLFWTLYFASRTKNKLKQLYFNGAVSMFFQQSLHLPKNKQPKWRLLWSHDPWDLISWFPLPSLGPSPMENPMLKG